MAIIQISRIKNRRGLQEDLPQPLAAAELGWAIDTRRLYIGNGPASEGAPTTGNTEILTEHSNILDLSNLYTFRGEYAGYIVKTGPGALDPATRSMQHKLDDVVNLRDFYSGPISQIGDGVAHSFTTDQVENPVSYINRAIEQLYKLVLLSNEPRVRRTLHIPAGTYVLSGDFIRLLPYVKIKGEGKNSTTIIQSDTSQPCVAASANYAGVVGASEFVEIEDLTLIHQGNQDVVQLDSSKDMLFNRVAFKGFLNRPISLGSIRSCVKVTSTTRESSDLMFLNCDFTGNNYGLRTESNTSKVNFIRCSFLDLYCGINLGEANNGAPGSEPRYFKVTHSNFDNIAREAIWTSWANEKVSDVVSAFNTFKNVGNGNTTITPYTPQCSVISFGGDNSYSIGDTFEPRSEATFKVVDLRGTASFSTLPGGRIQIGTLVTSGGTDTVMPFNTLTPTYLSTVGVGSYPTIVDYTILRGNVQRTGTLSIAPIGTSVAFSDDYVETDETGIILSLLLNSNVVDLYYTSSGVTADAIIKLSTRTLTGLLAPAPILTVPDAPTILGVI